MESKSILEVEESVQSALETLSSNLRSSPRSPLARQIGEALGILVPTGYHPVVELQENGRRKRRTASADNWTPETGEILISFSKDSPSSHHLPKQAEAHNREFGTMENAHQRDVHTTNAAQSQAPVANQTGAFAHSSVPTAGFSDSRERELCHALEEVEREGRAFVALKWFRDEILPSKGFAWTSDAEQRQAVLATAIAAGLIVTSRVPNPRSPFPTTAVRLNRAPTSSQGSGRRYSPIRVQGEPLSSTILRDRGAR